MSISLSSNTYPNISGLESPSNISPPANGPEQIIGTNNNSSYVIPLAFIIIIVIIIAYYILFSSLGSEVSTTSDNSSKTIELFLWGLFILLILLNGMSYIFNIDVIASIKNIFSPVTTVDLHIKETKQDTIATGTDTDTFKKQEVFHVSDNKYNYEDAKAICAAYDGRLANYNEISHAYNEGADWCGYGWSDKQMALFPTQEEKWNKLQTIDGHHHDCGRPGINGGYIANPNVRFGVNCYGYKPEITNEEAERMQNQQIYPKNKRERMFDKKVDYWRTKLSDIMVSPFNSDNWSII
jgi:hypothetical protein